MDCVVRGVAELDTTEQLSLSHCLLCSLCFYQLLELDLLILCKEYSWVIQFSSVQLLSRV